MKTQKMVFLFLLMPLMAYSQATMKNESIFQTGIYNSYANANEMADKLFSLLNKEKSVRENSTNKHNLYGEYVVAFYSDEFDRVDTPVTFSFYKTIINENKDLGIKGEKVFLFDKITGTFLDLYPIWEFINSEFSQTTKSKEELSKKLSDSFSFKHSGLDCTFMLKKTGNFWCIQLMVMTK